MIILPLIVLVYVSLWSFTCIWLHAQWICDWFQPNEWMLKYCLSFDFVRFVLRDPSLGEKYQYLPKVVLLLPRSVPPTTWVQFWVITNWRRCRGRKCISAPGERQGLREISVGKQGFRKQKEVVYFPWWLHYEIIQNSRTTFWLQGDIHEVTLIPKFWKSLKIQKDCLKRRVKKS